MHNTGLMGSVSPSSRPHVGRLYLVRATFPGMRRTLTTLAIALALAACSKSGSDSDAWQADDEAYRACEDMAQYANDGFPIASRQERMDDMSSWARQSANTQIAEQGATAAQLAASPDPTFRLALDVFAATCLDLGWEEANS